MPMTLLCLSKAKEIFKEVLKKHKKALLAKVNWEKSEGCFILGNWSGGDSSVLPGGV